MLVMVEHDLVRFTANAGFLVAAEGSVRRVGVVAVGPDAAGLDGAAHAIGHVAVAAPDAGAQPVQRVVGNRQCFGFVLEGGDSQHRAKDLFLEDAHLVVALEQRGLHVVATGQIPGLLRLRTTDQDLGAFLLAQIEVGQDLGQLLIGGLSANHGVAVERVALNDGSHAFQDTFHELVINRFLDQRARWAGADLTLVEGEQHQAFDRLVQETIVLVHDVRKEDVGRLAAEFQRRRNQVVGSGLRNHASRGGGAGEGNLGDALAGGQWQAGFTTVAVDDVEHAGWQQVGNQFGQDQDADRC